MGQYVMIYGNMDRKKRQEKCNQGQNVTCFFWPKLQGDEMPHCEISPLKSVQRGSTIRPP
jgi:hypothetical protein